MKPLPPIFRSAISASKHSDHAHYSVGASIIISGKTISVGYNHCKTHSITRKFDAFQTIHAEVSALIKCRHKHNLTGATIVVYRQNKSGRVGMARPCTTCMSLLKMFGVSQVIYTTNDGYCKEKI